MMVFFPAFTLLVASLIGVNVATDMRKDKLQADEPVVRSAALAFPEEASSMDGMAIVSIKKKIATIEMQAKRVEHSGTDTLPE
ncbi:hypothetical protein FNU76_17325 [Chitinimonas arctica]|uniref:Uncharacterized protein n=1 Tax=Chitinimonas arctica TaxID=2594795 RepID=A0A516SII4_9NEIS|nr:hypothetical protein [Chitinimonas arctica]QDQ27962.1 hypothetical protein FNU76_17325 [Chitinimonas arctica]